MLVSRTVHNDMFAAGGECVVTKERKSFFRRLHEKKPGAVKIDWEEVIIARKPVHKSKPCPPTTQSMPTVRQAKKHKESLSSP